MMRPVCTSNPLLSRSTLYLKVLSSIWSKLLLSPAVMTHPSALMALASTLSSLSNPHSSPTFLETSHRRLTPVLAPLASILELLNLLQLGHQFSSDLELLSKTIRAV